MTCVLITGASRGIGLALAELYAGRGDRVIATCRDPAGARALGRVAGDIAVEPMDVADHRSVEALAGRLSGVALDLLINNAGIHGGPRQRFGDIDYDAWAEAFRINTMGPAKVAEAFLANLAAGERGLLACITSEMGSIGRTTGGHYAYRSSKAALNMVGRTLAGGAVRARHHRRARPSRLGEHRHGRPRRTGLARGQRPGAGGAVRSRDAGR